MRTIFLLRAAALTAVAMPLTANGALYRFDLTGSRTASFTLESTAPDFASAYQTQFANVVGSFGGAPGVASSISFGAVSFINSLDISGTVLGFTQFGGPLLFTGPSSDPVFTLGTFALSGIVSGQSNLTIALAPVSPVPEPATWMLAIGVFGLAAYATTRGARSKLS